MQQPRITQWQQLEGHAEVHAVYTLCAVLQSNAPLQQTVMSACRNWQPALSDHSGVQSRAADGATSALRHTRRAPDMERLHGLDHPNDKGDAVKLPSHATDAQRASNVC